MVSEVSQFFRSKKLPEGIKSALICLIAKVGKPEFIHQFRPLSLCNVIYKVFSKVMAHRMQGILGELVGPTQG